MSKKSLRDETGQGYSDDSLGRARELVRRCEDIARFSESREHILRQYGTDALLLAQQTVADYMQQVGMTTRRDYFGNLIGRYEGIHHGCKAFVLGGHLDTVPNAGKYDGVLGVLAGIGAVGRLHKQARRMPFAIEVIAFADEEGTRFQLPCLGSRAMCGLLDPDFLERKDSDQIALADAIRTFGGDPSKLVSEARNGDEWMGFCEVHLEQGPILEAADLPVGVVSSIIGQTHASVAFSRELGVDTKKYGDALGAAASLILTVEAVARAEDGLVATVGRIVTETKEGELVSKRAELSIDVRHESDIIRRDSSRQLSDRAREISAGRRILMDWKTLQEFDTVEMDKELSQILLDAIELGGGSPKVLVSGAGHDAAVLSQLTPASMLFVRCTGGISHNPLELVTAEDVAVAVEVVDVYLELLARKPT